MKEMESQAEADDEGFLSRWSRRKQQAREGVAQEELSGSPVEHTAEPVAETPQEFQPTDADMPSLESLDEDSDYTGFMSPKVSEELRRLALRKLFHGSSFHVLDGLNDYDDDYTQFEKLGEVVTADMKFAARQEKLKAESEAAEARAEAFEDRLPDEEQQSDQASIDPHDGAQPEELSAPQSELQPPELQPQPELRERLPDSYEAALDEAFDEEDTPG